ncbi:putative HD superfamily hydrolase of NAD metabolism [Carnobacterium iners]|uniref:bis(5'-nucleosyl)-tetraphosphatase (symmetrical) n=1 Tax=Carnobacterium iners TaxID=1073423 RepID=A0A1X7NNW4_9LACT|nr:putative HD superfamily hydrolase of NAD metabolism [Carnobacterium iners]SMH39674.1 putative HD superfamily hydrolase of NAD metabolism [Carnobacterium iners]
MMIKSTNVSYSKDYIPFTRAELLDKVRLQMSQERFEHVLGVEKVAVELAQQYGASIEAASIAALIHDYAKERDLQEMHDLIISANLDLDLLQYGSEIWHGPVGAILAKKELRVKDEEILNAIRHHTVGSSNMSLLEQVIYVADYIEPGRDFPGVDEARKLAKSDLAKAVSFETARTLQYLILKQRKIYPKAIETYNTWVAKN